MNICRQNEEIMAILAKYRLNMIANGVLDTTGDQLVKKMTIILSDMMENHDVTISNGKFQGITGAVLQDWQARMVTEGKAPNTRTNYTVVLNEFLEWGSGRSLFEDVQSDVPLWKVLKVGKRKNKDADLPEEERKPKMFTEDQVRDLINNMDGHKNNIKRDKAIVAVFVGSGIRAFSLCGMNISDYKEQKHGRIRIKNKGGAIKLAHLADFAYDFVDAYLEERNDKDDMDAPLFKTQQNTRFTVSTLYKTIGKKQENLGLPKGLHIFRHTFITAAEHEGGLAGARDLAMHKNANTTNLYAHSSEEDLVRTVNNLPWKDL